MDPGHYAAPLDAQQPSASFNTISSASPSRLLDLRCTADRHIQNSARLPRANQSYVQGAPPGLALTKQTFWLVGKTLRVRFLNGATPKVKERIEHYAKQWSDFANIHLLFDDSSDAEIRISFDQNDGSWSYVGTNCTKIPLHEATMNFGWFDDNTREDEFARTTLHEFGHALGCIHEHQSSASRLNWDKTKLNQIYEYFRVNSGWSKDDVDSNVFTMTPAAELRTSPFDDQSVMLYEYPDYFFLDNKGTSWNWELSDIDKDFIGRIYPFRQHSKGKHVFNRSNTSLNFGIMDFEPPYSRPPQIALGLSQASMNISQRSNISVTTEDISRESFMLSINSGAGTRLSSAGANWLEVEANDRDMQTGTYSWPQADLGVLDITETIHFTYPYSSPPRILVWISGFSFGPSETVFLVASVQKVTGFSFDLRVRGPAVKVYDTGPDRVKITWLACRHDKTDVSMGDIVVDKTNIAKFSEPPQTINSGQEAFEQQSNFVTPPRVYLAFSGLQILQTPVTEFACSATEITKDGFRWNMSLNQSSPMFFGSISWIAFAGRVVDRQQHPKSFSARSSHWSTKAQDPSQPPKALPFPDNVLPPLQGPT